MTATAPAQIFNSREQIFAKNEKQYQEKSRLVAWIRLLVFLLGLSAVSYLFYIGQNLFGFLVLVVAYTIFLVVLRKHTHLQYKQKHNGFLKNINAEEQERLRGNLNIFEPGIQYINPQHINTSDLDIFGKHSLFQVLNRAVTGIGKDKLAQWLQQGAAAPEIIARQQATGELAADLDWRQHLQAKALHYKHTVEEPFSFFEWLQAPDFFQKHSWLKILVFLLPVLTVGSIIYFFSGYSFYPAGACMLTQYLLCYRFAAERDAYYDKSSGMYDVLRCYRDILEHIETRPSTSEKLVNLTQHLTVAGKPTSQHIHSLAIIIEYLSARMNVFMSFILNAIFMWDFFWMYRLENWKKRVASNMAEILEVVAETEALASLSAFQFANPDYAVPEISEVPFKIETHELGHPLIFSANRITNNFKMAGVGQTCIITGSNMSGKSTFLRTLGINLVLAQAGAVTSARQFKFFPTQVFTAMRTEDNLSESTSSFYAELKRLRLLLDLSANGAPVFYLLDEILKGTNSRDRHAGAKALIRQLHHRYAAGLVSTHDLELGAMQQEHPEFISNYSFNSTIKGDQILFDYKLHPGICQSFNASKLMQLMGIEMEVEPEKLRPWII